MAKKKNDFKTSQDIIAASSATLKKLESFYTKLEDFERVAKAINIKTVEKLNPILRQMVVSNYSKCGITVKSGDLLKAVSNSYLTLSKSGQLSVSMGAGADTKVYVRAGFFKKYRDFFTLSDGQKETLMNKFSEMWVVEANKWVEQMGRASGLV